MLFQNFVFILSKSIKIILGVISIILLNFFFTFRLSICIFLLIFSFVPDNNFSLKITENILKSKSIFNFLNIKKLDNKTFDKNLFNNIEKSINPFINNEKISLYWPSKWKNQFMFTNAPNNFSHDFNIKKDILHQALLLPKNYTIIDCGAHIGDGTVPIAQALKYYNREDIIIYAIEPSIYKCKFIEKIVQLNNLKNIKVLNYGLSDVNQTCYSLKNKFSINSGGLMWDNIIKDSDDTEKCNFVKLDTLYEKGIIEKIGIIHFDVEGNEEKALKGSKKIINELNPYLSIEQNDLSLNQLLNFLAKKYKFEKKIESNIILRYIS